MTVEEIRKALAPALKRCDFEGACLAARNLVLRAYEESAALLCPLCKEQGPMDISSDGTWLHRRAEMFDDGEEYRTRRADVPCQAQNTRALWARLLEEFASPA